MAESKAAKPISIWQPVADDAGDTVWRRPPPTGLGDHYAVRREIRRRAEPGVRRVCFFGESVAAGYLYAPHLTPAEVLEAELHRRAIAGSADGWEVLDFARTNERSASLADTVEAAAQLAPDHLVIFTGNNPKLLDTPELSPYAPSPAARRELAVVLAGEGAEGLARLARRRWAGGLAAALGRVAAVAVDLGARVTLVLPEVNLADWQTAEPPPRLAGEGGARWFELLDQARRTLAELAPGSVPGQGAKKAGAAARRRSLDAVEAAAWEMVALDGGLCPTPFRLLAEARRMADMDDRAAAEAARDAAISELEATHYPLLASLAAPRADEVARRVLAAAARRHGFAAVDLRPLFAAHTGSPLPGRRLFLDYCHLTAEGIGVAMAAVAAELSGAESADGELAPAGAAPPKAGRPRAPSAAAEATACLGAAVHTAHRHLPVTDHGELLAHWCRRALEHDPGGAAAAMLDLASARLAAAAGGPDLPALLTAAEERNRARPAPLLLQHGWRWPHLDGDLLRAMHAALAAAGRPEAGEMAGLVARAVADLPASLELAHPPRFLTAPVARTLPAAMASEGMPHRAFLRALWPRTCFDVPDPHRQWRRIAVVARRPRATGDGAPRARVEAEVSFGGRRIGELPLTERWEEHTLHLPDGGAAAGLVPRRRSFNTGSLNIGRLTIAWPPLGDAAGDASGDSGSEPLAAAIRRLEAGLEAEIHAVFGELFSLRLLR